MNTTAQEVIAALAKQITAEGFRAFIAKKGTYGFYTDKDGARVVTFELDFGAPKFAGTYVSELPKRTGTGWILDIDTFTNMLRQPAPVWAHQGVKWRHTTLKEHLATYDSSSRYTEVEA